MRFPLTLTAGLLLAIATLTTGHAQSDAAGTVTVDHAWARATPGGAKTGAVYMTITNNGSEAERLIGGASPDAATVQVHEMKVVNNVMQMREVPGGLAIPAHGTVTLKPGSYHVMLIGLKKPLKAGDAVPLTLRFDKAAAMTINVPVETMGADDMGGMKMQ